MSARSLPAQAWAATLLLRKVDGALNHLGDALVFGDEAVCEPDLAAALHSALVLKRATVTITKKVHWQHAPPTQDGRPLDAVGDVYRVSHDEDLRK